MKTEHITSILNPEILPEPGGRCWCHARRPPGRAARAGAGRSRPTRRGRSRRVFGFRATHCAAAATQGGREEGRDDYRLRTTSAVIAKFYLFPHLNEKNLPSRLRQDRAIYGNYPTNPWYGWQWCEEEKKYVKLPELVSKEGDGKSASSKLGSYVPLHSAKDLGKIHLVGYSSGGHLAALWSLRNGVAKSNGAGGDGLMRIRIQEQKFSKQSEGGVEAILKKKAAIYRLVEKPAVNERVHLLSPVLDLLALSGAPKALYEDAYSPLSLSDELVKLCKYMVGAVLSTGASQQLGASPGRGKCEIPEGRKAQAALAYDQLSVVGLVLLSRFCNDLVKKQVANFVEQ